MAAPKTFEDLDAWQAARHLTNEAYRLARREPLARDFGSCDQLRRAALSVMNNIAEGWESLHVAEKKQFYNWSRRSCGEVRSMSYVLLDNRYIDPQEQQALLESCNRTGKLVSGLIRALDNRNSTQSPNAQTRSPNSELPTPSSQLRAPSSELPAPSSQFTIS